MEREPLPLEPIEDYDDLMAAEILPELAALDVEDLLWVWRRENSGAQRTTVLGQAERLIVARGGKVPATRKRATKKKAAAKPSSKTRSRRG